MAGRCLWLGVEGADSKNTFRVGWVNDQCEINRMPHVMVRTKWMAEYMI